MGAEKLSLMTSAELRYFGIRFGVKSQATDSKFHTGKARVNEVNPSFSSTGVHSSIKCGNIDDSELPADVKGVRRLTPSGQESAPESSSMLLLIAKALPCVVEVTSGQTIDFKIQWWWRRTIRGDVED